MRKYYKITPEGTRDLLFEECTASNEVSNIIEDVFSSRGYSQVITPGIEFYDTFTLDSSGITPEDMFMLTDKKGRLMVMRPDSTIPIARMASTRLQNEKLPLRLSYNQIIYRNNKSLAGKSNEIRQAGIELVGVSGKRADLELITAAVEVLKKLVPDFRIELGHAAFFKALVNKLPVSHNKREEIRISIESKNYSTLNSILDEMEQTDTVKALRKLPRLFGGEEVFEKALPLFKDTQAEIALAYLKELYKSLSTVLSEDKLMIDLGLVQRNDYYSDIIFSAYILGSGDAILSGGRYDNLFEEFQNPMPAAGFGINVSELAKILLNKSAIERLQPVNILVHSEDGFEMQGISMFTELKQSGEKCELSVFENEADVINYAKEKGIKTICFVGNEVRKVEI